MKDKRGGVLVAYIKESSFDCVQVGWWGRLYRMKNGDYVARVQHHCRWQGCTNGEVREKVIEVWKTEDGEDYIASLCSAIINGVDESWKLVEKGHKVQ